MAIEIRRASVEDYQGILELQARYFIGNLPEERRSAGFLSAEFSLSQISAMAEDPGIIVARDGTRVAGYMCTSRADLTPLPPILDSMLRSLREVVFQGKRLSESSLFIYGPVCIDEAYRGKGLLRKMFDALKSELRGKFEVGVAFVAADNPHSLGAHTRGLGITEVGRFEHDGKEYHTVAFGVAL